MLPLQLAGGVVEDVARELGQGRLGAEHPRHHGRLGGDAFQVGQRVLLGGGPVPVAPLWPAEVP